MEQAKKKLKKPVEEVRKELLADKDTAHIAKTLGMKLEDYVELVLSYATNPGKEVMVTLIDEAEGKAQGGASMEEVKGWFERQIKKAELEGDNFEPSGPHDKPKL
jgi:DNA-directed RNA polymerase specialized sigma subunit